MTHGASQLQRILATTSLALIDKRSAVGVALRRTRDDLLAQYGDVTAAEALLVSEVAKLHVLARALSQWLFAQDSLVRADGEVVPALREYTALVGALRRLLVEIGMHRRAAEVETDLQAFLRARAERSK